MLKLLNGLFSIEFSLSPILSSSSALIIESRLSSLIFNDNSFWTFLDSNEVSFVFTSLLLLLLEEELVFFFGFF